jgi:outer membrane protein TolC
MRATTPRGLPQRVLLAGCLLLGACTMVGPNFVRPEVPWLANWSSSALRSDATARGQQREHPTIDQWWRNFDDPALNLLIAEAQRQNTDVRIAGLRILEARAQLGLAGSTLYPQVQQPTGDVLRLGQRNSNGPDSAAWSYRAGLDIAWELDFWGKFRRGVESADAAYFASIASHDDGRCWSRHRPPASTSRSAPSNSACASRTKTRRCRNAASKSPNKY